MTDVAVPLAETESVAIAAPPFTTFPELVWTHYKWERNLHGDGPHDPVVEARYRVAQASFQHEHGKIYDAYWSTTNASAVAITFKRAPRPLCWLGKDPTLRFHRATDWVTKDAPEVTDVMQRCDTLAIRASEVLRGTWSGSRSSASSPWPVICSGSSTAPARSPTRWRCAMSRRRRPVSCAR